MPAFVLLAPKPLSGKTTIAAALAQRLKADGKTVALSRLGDDANAPADKALFAAISSPADAAQVTLTEAAAGESATAGSRPIVVADAGLPAGEIAAFCRALADPIIILNRMPVRRADSGRGRRARGIRIRTLPCDRPAS